MQGLSGRSKEPLAADASGLALLSPSLHGQIHTAREPAQATGAASLSDPASCSSIGSPLESCTDKSDPAQLKSDHGSLHGGRSSCNAAAISSHISTKISLHPRVNDLSSLQLSALWKVISTFNSTTSMVITNPRSKGKREQKWRHGMAEATMTSDMLPTLSISRAFADNSISEFSASCTLFLLPASLAVTRRQPDHLRNAALGRDVWLHL